jgi:hypothetical protein
MLAKSSNWMSALGKFLRTAVTNSSTSSSYSRPRTRPWRMPM